MIGSSADLLEDNFREPYTAWKKQQGPETNRAILTALAPTIEGAIRTHVGPPNPLLTSRARVMTLQGLPAYDPKRGRLSSYTYNHLLGLKRANRQQTQILKVPERVVLDKYSLDSAEAELRAVLGTEPTDQQLADHTGFSPRRMAKIRKHQSGIAEGYMDESPDGAHDVFGGVQLLGKKDRSIWADVIYDELDDYHKKIMELAFGLNGRRPLPNHVIADKMSRSPGAISQAKLRIQKMLDQEQELSPFGG
jgi:DNA-directed RNA polymerase specialized sigma subunit